MPHASTPLVSQFLRCLTAPYGDSSTDHELLQRFVACCDESAFTALVQRHAAMVLGLCRSILRNYHDAEDIFQATFLVLARRAGTIRKSESLGSWLYAVAYRLAHKARARAGKRRSREQQAASSAEQTPMDAVTWGELREVLHAEVSRLPEKNRAAVVLCYWQGKTHEQAGQQLGCAGSTIKDRLDKARELLRKRLARRGLALSAAWFAASLSEGTSAAVAVNLVQATARGAIRFALGQGMERAISAQAVAAAKNSLQTMLPSKLKYGLTLMLMIGILSGGAGLTIIRQIASLEGPVDQPKNVAAPKEEPKHVDRHGDPLPAGAVARLGTVRFRHDDPVEAIALAPDGKSIVSAAGRIVYVWDLATGKEQRRFDGFDRVLTSVAISHDGKLLAAGCQDGTIILWDMAANRELRRIEAHMKPDPNRQGPVGALLLQFTTDGGRLASVGADNALRLWDTATGKTIPGIGGHFHSIGRFALSPDGKTLAGIVEEKGIWEVRQWDVTTGREGKRLATTKEGRIANLAFSPDSKLLAVGMGENNWEKPFVIQLWDMAGAREVRTLHGLKGWASFAFSPDGRSLVAAGSLDRTVYVWDANTGKELRRVRGDLSTPIAGFLLCADGKTLVSTSHQGEHSLRFWSLASGKEVQFSGDAGSPASWISFSPDGRLLAAGSYDGVIRLWDVVAKKEVRRFQHDPGFLTSMLFSPDGRKLVSTALHEIWIWDAASGKTLQRIKGTKDRYATISSLAWSGDGQVLAGWLREQRRICLWDAATGAELRRLDCGDTSINALAFSPNGKTLAAAGGSYGRGNCLLLWETDTGRLLRSLTPRHTLHCVAFSPDGRTLAAGGRRSILAGDSQEDREILLWEVVSGRPRLTLKFDDGATSLAFSPDGRLLAAACNKTYSGLMMGNGCVDVLEKGKPTRQRIHLWDVAAAKELPPLEGHHGTIRSLSFAPDGKLLASGSNDTTVLLWDAMRFKPPRPAEILLRPEQLESLWADLAGADAVQAYRAIRTLASAPKSSVANLQKHLRPVEPVDAKQVAHLVADLDSDEFAARDKAMQQLEKLGESAIPELRKALAGKPSLEVKCRIKQLLEKSNDVEHIRMVRALETLEKIGTPEARDFCAHLAEGVADAPLTREARATLRRLVR